MGAGSTIVGSHLAAVNILHQTLPRTSNKMANIAPLHGGINILLAGLMMGCMLLVVVCICYCCHKRVQKSNFPTEGSEQWLYTEDSESNLAIFTVEGQQCYEEEGLFVEDFTPQPSPPPSYCDVMAAAPLCHHKDSGLPSYEEALKTEQRSCTIYMDQLTYI